MALNEALRSAIFRTGKTQRLIAVKARIPEARVSELIRGRGREVTSQERKRLLATLNREYLRSGLSPIGDEASIFPTSQAVNL